MMDAVILCGGKGTRLASVVSDLPKPLAPVAGRPFLDYVLDYLLNTRSVRRIVLATGHLADKVEKQYGSTYCGIPVVYSREETPLGTGGAVLNALRQHSLSDPFLLLNGDSFIDADLNDLLAAHTSNAARLTMALHEVADSGRFGTVELSGSKVTAFLEKTGLTTRGLINSGVYLLNLSTLSAWENRGEAFSLEVDMIPALLGAQDVYGVKSGKRFIDIGLPDTYAMCSNFFA
jgi:D-glycero-alpha-D-manno-heptose 1-phosphate guanylyltransferase